jgi:alkylhydroperoxidase family enzyme
VKPRIPLPTSKLTTYGNPDEQLAVPDASDLAPEIAQARSRSQSLTFALAAVNDPVLTEMVRLRNARFQDCKFCQSTRSPAARAQGATESLYADIDDYEASGLSERQKAALRLADAYLLWPAGTSEEVRAGALEHFTPEQIIELILRLLVYSSDKVMISLNLDLDKPLISTGGSDLSGEVGVAALVGDEAGVGAGFDDLAMIQDDDLVGVSHG